MLSTARQASSAPFCWTFSRLSGWGRGGRNLWTITIRMDKHCWIFSNHLNHQTIKQYQEQSYPPVWDQSWNCWAGLELVGARRAWFADQNHPLIFLGSKSGRSHPSKLQSLPEVQIYLTPDNIKNIRYSKHYRVTWMKYYLKKCKFQKDGTQVLKFISNTKLQF